MPTSERFWKRGLDLLMVKRKQAGLSVIQLKARTGIRMHWLRRWEFDLCVPLRDEWEILRKVLNLSPSPVLITTQHAHSKRPAKSLGDQPPRRRFPGFRKNYHPLNKAGVSSVDFKNL